MRWTSRKPPEHIREGDIWVREPEYDEFKCDIEKKVWYRDGEFISQMIPFPNKTKVYKG